MAIAYDNSSNTTPASTSSSFSFTTSGSNRILIADLFLAAGTVSTITYNGVTMTLLDSDSSFATSYRYYLLNPATGANTFSVTSSGLPILEINLASYNGVAGGIGVNNKATVTASSISNSLTTTVANSWVNGSIITNSSPQTFTASGSGFIRLDGNGAAVIDTNSQISSPSSVTMGASYTFSTQAVMYLLELKSVANTANSSALLMMTPA